MRPGLSGTLALSLAAAACLPPEWGANAILHPWRRPLLAGASLPHESVTIQSEGLALHGWVFRTTAPRRGWVVYLHGVSDNRRGAERLARRLGPRGYDVLAYDARAHGQSDGTLCSYGFFEKRDVTAALDSLGAGEAILFGSSLGAAVALQAAPEEPRVRAVVAQSPFSDLRSIIGERRSLFATKADVASAISLAEQQGGFRVDDVSPVAAARHIRVPVLLIHGADDRRTRPEHSNAIFAALAGPRQLLLVPGRGHNDVLAGEDVWRVILDWLDRLPAVPGS